jgi:GNAT superfamily N-acetyltransferase
VGLAVVRHELLERFFVMPERWGTGVADALHEAVLQALRERGDPICRLWVMEENHRARRFYERQGWRLDGQRRPASFPPFPPGVGYVRSVNASSEG